jgi:hypothetical protein
LLLLPTKTANKTVISANGRIIHDENSGTDGEGVELDEPVGVREILTVGDGFVGDDVDEGDGRVVAETLVGSMRG